MKSYQKTLISVLLGAGLTLLPQVQANEDPSHGMNHDGHTIGESKVGQSGKGMVPSQTIKVTMLDTMRFEFDQTPVLRDGDVVKFVVTNQGKIPHEFSIGTPEEQQHHREMMKEMPNMNHGNSDNAVTVQPGQTTPLLWKFIGKEQVLFACNVPGHFEAGMKHSTRIQ